MTSYGLGSNEVVKSMHTQRCKQMQFYRRHVTVTLVHQTVFVVVTKQLVILLWGLWNWRTPPPYWRNPARDAEAGKAPTARWMDKHVTRLKHCRWCGCSGHRVTACHTSSDLVSSAIIQIAELGIAGRFNTANTKAHILIILSQFHPPLNIHNPLRFFGLHKYMDMSFIISFCIFTWEIE